MLAIQLELENLGKRAKGKKKANNHLLPDALSNWPAKTARPLGKSAVSFSRNVTTITVAATAAQNTALTVERTDDAPSAIIPATTPQETRSPSS